MPCLGPARRLAFHITISSTAVLAAGLLAALEAGTIRGRVVDSARQPVTSVRVIVAGPLGLHAVFTDAGGRFEVPDLAAARYRVLVEAAGFRAEPHRVTLGANDDADVTLVLHVAALQESVVVSAAQVEIPLSEAPGAITVVDAAELRERQVDTLAGALGTVPGLGVTRTGGLGALTSIFPRGGESDYTLVLVDGLRLNAFGGGFDAAQLALGNVERIEVVRGPQSAIFGSDAIGAVVQVVTAHGGPIRAGGLVEGGSFGTWRAAASTGGSREDLSWSGSAERHVSDGVTGRAASTGEPVRNDDGWQEQLAGSMGWQANAEARLRGTVRYFRSERGFPGPYGSDPIGAFPGVDLVARGRNDHLQLGASATHAWSRRVRQRYAFTASDLDSRFASAFGPSNFETRRLTARAQTDVVLNDAGSLSAGVEAAIERARSTFITGANVQELPIERTVLGPYVEWRQQVGDRVALTAGLRGDHVSREALESDASPFNPRPPFAADRRTALNPRAAIVWTAWRDPGGAARTRIHGSAGTGIRPPDAFEIAFTDNPRLAPERSRSVEAGAAHTLAGGAVDVEATAFSNTYDDLIVTIGRSLQDASRYRSDNVSNARARGVETGIAWRTAWGLTARVSYTWLDTEILAVDRTGLAPPPFDPGDPLVRRPRHAASLDLRVTRSRIAAFVEAGGRGRALDIEPNFGASGGLFHTPGYAVISAGAAIRLTRRVEVHARGVNLADRTYEEVLGFPAPGRSGTVGVRVALGR